MNASVSNALVTPVSKLRLGNPDTPAGRGMLPRSKRFAFILGIVKR